MAQKPTLNLTDRQIAQFNEEGFLVVHGFTTPDECASVKSIYDRLFAERAGRASGNQFDLAGSDEEGKEAKLPQILGPHQYAPELTETLAWANAGALLRQIYGTDEVSFGDHAILKPARNGAPTPWHQDQAYWDAAQSYRSLSTWLPLQDTSIEMGCMWFIPGSHRGEILDHRPIGGDIRVHGLEVDPALGFDFSDAVACPLPAGSVTIHDSKTLHYAAGNNTDEPRRAWILSGGAPSSPWPGPERSFPWQALRNTAREKRARESVQGA
ncbi:phytanoyl-CoA dioxygenase family protein [bacterium]|nr:MAG: phytanoyl-CoA dioxygenase family protein [bacterium]